MAKIELIMPKMGESIMEATILGWLKQPGDAVEMDEPILEIATDKVDSEVPSPVDGVIQEVFFEVDDVVEVGKVIAIISTEAIAESTVSDNKPTPEVVKDNAVEPVVSVTESNEDRKSVV
jgi:2-oxoglutarate dehydrogenase E2 component (dihydrolipoamide succinyltransferase)